MIHALVSLFFYRVLKMYMLEKNLHELFCNSRVVIEKITDFVLSGIFFCSSHLTGYFFI